MLSYLSTHTYGSWSWWLGNPLMFLRVQSSSQCEEEPPGEWPPSSTLRPSRVDDGIQRLLPVKTVSIHGESQGRLERLQLWLLTAIRKPGGKSGEASVIQTLPQGLSPHLVWRQEWCPFSPILFPHGVPVFLKSEENHFCKETFYSRKKLLIITLQLLAESIDLSPWCLILADQCLVDSVLSWPQIESSLNFLKCCEPIEIWIYFSLYSWTIMSIGCVGTSTVLIRLQLKLPLQRTGLGPWSWPKIPHALPVAK